MHSVERYEDDYYISVWKLHTPLLPALSVHCRPLS